MLNKHSGLAGPATILIYVAIGVAAGILFAYLANLYVDLFGETYTAMTKFVASTVSLTACLLIVFSVNYFSLKLNNRRLGVALSFGMFAWLYIIGPGLRAPITLYITSVSFPYNINMLTTLLMPLIIARVLGYALDHGDRTTEINEV